MKTHQINFLGEKVHYAESSLAGKTGPTIVLLHGARFSSQIWMDLGTMNYFAAAGFRVIALDLPGFGKSTGRAPRDRGTFLAEFLKMVNVDKCVLISPSMSGGYSIPFLLDHSTMVSHFIPVAPVGIPANLESLGEIEVPTLVLWGGNDQVIPVEHGTQLAESMPNAALQIFPGGAHPFYLDVPDNFHRAIQDFLAN